MNTTTAVFGKWLRWEEGRQHTGYFKMLLGGSVRFKFDVYLLKFTQGASIPFHTDPVANARHFRLNIVIKAAHSGGQFLCDKPLWTLGKRVFFFRSDTSLHAVSKDPAGVTVCVEHWLVAPRVIAPRTIVKEDVTLAPWAQIC